MSGVVILAFAALLALVARAWFVGSTRAAVPTFLWNGLLIPVVVALYGAEETLIATAVLVIVVLGIVTAAGAVPPAAPTPGRSPKGRCCCRAGPPATNRATAPDDRPDARGRVGDDVDDLTDLVGGEPTSPARPAGPRCGTC